MRAIFIAYSTFDQTKGISKKIQTQVEALRKNGLSIELCHYLEDNGCRYWAIDGSPIAKIGSGINAYLRYLYYLKPVEEYILKNKIELVYLRYVHNATPWMLSFFKNLKRHGVKIIMEIPTFPYDGEYTNCKMWLKLPIALEHYSRNKFHKYVDFIVTFSNDKSIFKVPTINLSNAIDFKSIPLSTKIERNNEIHMVGVANLMFWHGYDRLICGLSEYYKKEQNYNVVFDIVGGGSLMNELKQLAYDKGVSEHVIFHGLQYGDKLDDIVGNADMCVGCLACHRKGIEEVKSLKNVEYAVRGIPFMYSEKNDDFDDKSYVYKARPDESAIDIDNVIQWLNSQHMSHQEIRNTVTHLSWDTQMKKIINALDSKC
jgi:glycosyltransferase involved in cell wall biosynthesis